MIQLFCFQMLAKEIVEDSILPFLTHEPPDIDMEGESTSHKVVHSEPFLLLKSLQGAYLYFILIYLGSFKNKTWAIISSSACQSCNHG